MLTILKILDERKGIVFLAGGIIIGLIIGLIFAWGIWPVRWQNASPGHLRSDFQTYYLKSVAEDYDKDRNWDVARNRLGLDLKGRNANPWVNDPETLKATLEQAAELEEVTEGTPMDRLIGKIAEEQGIEVETQEAEPEGEPAREGLSLFTILGLTLIVIAAVAAVFFFLVRGREQKPGAEEPKTGRAGAFGTVAAEEDVGVVEGETGPPLSSHKAKYELGDDFFDPSFSIEREGEFLGECGIGISESIGVEDPKKVTALEAWLFDKSDIKTVTTVLASDYAYDDPSLLAKLESKGKDVEVVNAQPGMEVVLETTALRVRVTVKSVVYADGDLPDNSYFKELGVEIRAWVKDNPAPPV